MAHASRKSFSPLSLSGPLGRAVREGGLIVLVTVSVYLILSLHSYYPTDPGWSHSGRSDQIFNDGGVAGAWIADVFLHLFGYLAYLFPIMIAYGGWLLYQSGSGEGLSKDIAHWVSRASGFLLTLGAGTGLATMHFRVGENVPLDAGGILGNQISTSLVGVFSTLGGTLFLLCLFLTGVTLLTSLSWLTVMDVTGRLTLGLFDRVRAIAIVAAAWGIECYRARRARREREDHVEVELQRTASRKPPRVEPTITRLEPSLRVEKERQVPLFDPTPADSNLPPLALLDDPPADRQVLSDASLEAISRQVELKLRDFGVEVEVVAVHPGPVVTRFELDPAPGTKVSRVTALAKDLARSLSTISVRIVEIIPGKSVIGLEIPNPQREIIAFSEIVKFRGYDESQSPLTLALGKDVAGHPVVADLARMPHLLVAGTTGAGKSVALNAMVLSLLFKATAADVRLIMIDPKMLELSVYEGIPHLLAPVVTDMKDAAHALNWCVAEMERRYQIMSALGVRNLAGYNRKIKEAADSGEPILDPLFKPREGFEDEDEAEVLDHLPMIVVIVDELADLMMVAGKKVEELIARLAQKARASGMHLILATQRPSVDVITGLIKANVPTRIAFQVSAKVDSRTILDQMGAEQLLGHGDMLYLAPGMPTPTRVHGAFVSDQEVHKVVNELKESGEANYLDEILSGSGSGGSGGDALGLPFIGGSDDDDADELYDQAVRIVTESRRASISGVQRRLKIGYNRAARMIEQMEEEGVVGPLQSNGAREVVAPPPPSVD